MHGLQKLSGVRVTFDGKDVTAGSTRDGDKLTFTTGNLADGPHAVSFVATSSNLFRHQVRKDWRFTVDTSIPTLKLDGAADEGRINTSPASFSGSTEPFSTVTVASGAVKASGAGGRLRQVHGQRQAAGRAVDGAGDHDRPRRQHDLKAT